MGINIREIDYNNELGNYKLYIDSVELSFFFKTINISGKVYLEYTISNPINYKNVLHVAWDLKNLSLDNKIRSLDDIEAYSSEDSHSVINNIDGIKISNSSNVSQKSNYFEIKLDFSRINSNTSISPFNALGGDIFDNSYLNDFSIKKNGVLISANSILKKDDSLVLSINYSESDFSNVIDVSDNIEIEYVGNKRIIDQYTNTLLREPPINIINNVTNIGNIVNAVNPLLEKDKIILLFDTDICGNTINIEDFEINIPITSGITILNVIREYERTLKIFLSSEITDATESTVTIKENIL